MSRAVAASTPEELFAGNEPGLAAYHLLHEAVTGWGGCTERVGRSQVGFARARGFAWLWDPRRYLRSAAADVVVTFALDHELDSPRVKQAVRTSPLHVVHHVELSDGAADLDEELLGWLREAFERSGGPGALTSAHASRPSASDHRTRRRRRR